jgi:DNA-binding response OmpR family regulator
MFPFWKSKPSRLAEITERLPLPLEEAKKRATILVVDDDTDAFPVELLRAEGYNIQQWLQVNALRDLEGGQFDIIVLDIHGVCPPGLSQSDGLGILEHLKRVNPSQIVIAYSGKKYDLKHEKFWRIADDYLGKPTDMLVAKAKIDALLRDKFTAKHYWESLAKYLRANGVSERELGKLERIVSTAVLEKKVVRQPDIAKLLGAGKDIIATAWIIVQVIMKLA